MLDLPEYDIMFSLCVEEFVIDDFKAGAQWGCLARGVAPERGLTVTEGNFSSPLVNQMATDPSERDCLQSPRTLGHLDPWNPGRALRSESTFRARGVHVLASWNRRRAK